MDRLKAGAKSMWDQYWGGTRQLWADAREARALRKRIRDTIETDALVELTRRETRFLRRVADDLRALAPFIAFFMLPGSAYALPLIVRFFPSFLPSTFHPPRYAESLRRSIRKVVGGVERLRWVG
jgi:LETM1 and EF-hand domain-containing protein 1